MAILPHLNTIISTVDGIHKRLSYAGGAFRLREFFDTYPGFLIQPVDGEGLPRGVSAAMQREGGCVRIAYDRDLSRGRQRFALAHEIGHALLHAAHLEGCELRGTSFEDEEIAERQANFFAAELLMPLWALERALPEDVTANRPPHSFASRIVRRLAARFEVSQTAMRIQLESYASVRRTQAGRASHRIYAGIAEVGD